MAHVVLGMLPQRGHLNPTFRFAKAIAARGHSVSYLTLEDFEPLIRAQGFRFVPLLERVFPKGTLGPSLPQLPPMPITDALFRWARSGESVALWEKLRPGLVIADVLAGAVALSAHRARLKTLSLCTSLPLAYQPHVPPLAMAHVPRSGPVDGAYVRLLWGAVHVYQRFLPSPYPRNWAKQLARECGYPPDAVDERCLWHPQLTHFPQLVLCPRAFDFPRPDLENVHYVEPSVDLERADEAEFPWERLESGRPLVYCALGTNSHLRNYGDVRPFLRTVIDAVASRPRYQLVISTGGGLDNEFSGLPPNVIAVPKAPQIELLKRASVMITHGGLGTVKECIMTGVPMVVFPFAYDQRGNSARVVHHGLGVRGDRRKSTPASVAALLERADGDPAIRERLGAMRRRFLEAEHASAGVEFVDRMLS